MRDEIKSRFSFHKPDAHGIDRMREIRAKVRELADLIDVLCPVSPERSTAFTQLAFVMMSANSAIVQEYPVDPAELEGGTA
jgi:hypothetical protein